MSKIDQICNAMYVGDVERWEKNILDFKAETESFPTIPTNMYVGDKMGKEHTHTF